jgi:serpin B
VLHYALPPKKLHPVLGQLQRQLNEKGKAGDFQLAVANALWRQQGYVLLTDYVQMTEKFYQAPLEELDFVQAAEEARLRINGWVEEKTQEKIQDLIQPGVLDAATRLVLTNAIYFKGDWLSQFKKEDTEKAPFYVTKEEQSEAEMMFQEGECKYAEADGIQILELPYQGEQLSMLVLLPGKRDGLKDLENKLTGKNLQAWQGKTKRQEVEIYLPKFKMTSEFSLGKVLAEMGMGDAFSMQADFSGMNGNKELFLSAAVHKAFVEVHEEGTEAAAATGIVMTLGAMPTAPAVFRADHPFVFGIRDNEFGSILFLGRVVKPGD